MNVIILAGGFGTRLQSVINGLPKPMAPVGRRPFLEYLLDNLKKNGFYNFIFCLHYLAEKVKAHFSDGSKFGVRINYSLEEEPLGTAGAIGLLRDRFDDAFCVVNADTYLEINVQDFIAQHEKRQAFATMALVRVCNPERYGQVGLDDRWRVTGFTEKGQSQIRDGYINAGFYLFDPEVFTYIPANKFVSLEKDVFPAMLKKGEKVYGYPHVANFFDVGIPQDYFKFCRWVASGQP
jgi:NDP-sugar pyrophosphorylase family protein